MDRHGEILEISNSDDLTDDDASELAERVRVALQRARDRQRRRENAKVQYPTIRQACSCDAHVILLHGKDAS